MQNIQLFAYVCGLGAHDPGCDQGPQVLLNDHTSQANHVLHLVGRTQYFRLPPNRTASDLHNISQLNRRLAEAISTSMNDQVFPIVIGGDHSSAVGTWSGVQNTTDNLGLLWMDAHMDSHTPKTSPSGKIHGMPLASLLGEGPSELTEILHDRAKLDAKNVCLFGVRSFEAEEYQLLTKLGVKIFFAAQIRQKGLRHCLKLALQHINRHSDGFGISIDLDVFDPIDLPGVGSPEVDGLRVEPFYEVLSLLEPWKDRFKGLEISEFNPRLDQEGITAQWVNRLLHRFLAVKATSMLSH